MADFAAAAVSSRRLLTPIPTSKKPQPPKNLRFSLLLRPIKSCSSAVASQKASPLKLSSLISEFQSLPQSIDRVKRLLDYASTLPPFPAAERTLSNRVMGCTAQVWLSASMNPSRTMSFWVDSDSEITKGFCACLISVLDGATPEEVLSVRPEDFVELNVGVGVGVKGRGQSRANTWHNVLVSMQKRTKILVAELEGRSPVETFPSLVIGADGVEAKGSYAEAQVR